MYPEGNENQHAEEHVVSGFVSDAGILILAQESSLLCEVASTDFIEIATVRKSRTIITKNVHKLSDLCYEFE